MSKWGSAVLLRAPPALHLHASAVDEAAAWRRYYIQRVAWFVLPTSPIQLIQEFQRGDPWRIMVACQVASRTGASLAKHDVIGSVLSAFPTPTAMMSAPKDTLEAMLDRVGMQEQRANALLRMSGGFLGDWRIPCQLYGIGPFGQESVYLFQRGAAAWVSFKTNDTSLSMYLSWSRNDLRALAGGAADAETGACKHAAAAAAVAGGGAAKVAMHTAAQAHLMAKACPADMKRETKRCLSAPASCVVSIQVDAARKRKTDGARAEAGVSLVLPADGSAKRPRRAAASAAYRRSASDASGIKLCKQ